MAEGIAAWGEPVGVPGNMPAFRPTRSNTAADQAVQMGMHHDGIHFYPLDGSSTRGLLVMNHEYTDDGLLHTDGMKTWTAEKVRKAQAAHGVSVIEVELTATAAGRWCGRRATRAASPRARRSPCAGPAAGHALMKTAADPDRPHRARHAEQLRQRHDAVGHLPRRAKRTGPFYFDGGDQRRRRPDALGPAQDRRSTAGHEHDERFDATQHPNEFNRFGWVVEIDPYDPASTPVKRTALGRAAHEGAWVARHAGRPRGGLLGRRRALRVHLQVRQPRPHRARAARRPTATLLDHGTLYVARFDADGSGRWLPLVHGQGPLTAAERLRRPGRGA